MQKTKYLSGFSTALNNAGLYFKRNERKAIMVLLCLNVLLIFSLVLLPYWRATHYTPESLPDLSSSLPPTADFITTRATYADTFPARGAALRPVPFNPNTVTREEMINMGIPAKAVESFIKFRSNGWGIKNMATFERIHALKPYYEQLIPYVQFDTPTDITTPYAPRTHNYAATPAPTAELRPFDPNSATEDDMLSFGIPRAAVNHIINYRKNGKFRSKDDIRRLNSLPPADYARIEPYISIAIMALPPAASPSYQKPTPSASAKTKTNQPVNINTATKEDWLQLQGMNAYWATVLLNKRQQYGGFGSIEQLQAEKWLPDSVFTQIRPQLQWTAATLPRININTATEEDLKKLPYLRIKLANLIVMYRTQHGAYKSVEEIKNIKVITPDIFQKIAPYLSV